MFSEYGNVTMALFAVSPNKDISGERSSEHRLQSEHLSLTATIISLQVLGVKYLNACNVYSFQC